jgi:hypothetical protein
MLSAIMFDTILIFGISNNTIINISTFSRRLSISCLVISCCNVILMPPIQSTSCKSTPAVRQISTRREVQVSSQFIQLYITIMCQSIIKENKNDYGLLYSIIIGVALCIFRALVNRSLIRSLVFMLRDGKSIVFVIFSIMSGIICFAYQFNIYEYNVSDLDLALSQLIGVNSIIYILLANVPADDRKITMFSDEGSADYFYQEG